MRKRFRASAIAKPRSKRRARGAYFTPDALAAAICRSLADEIGAPRDVLEPGCGGGAFLRAARAVWPGVDLDGVDLVPKCEGPGAIWPGSIFDLCEGKLRAEDGWALIVGNPDFLHAEKIVRHCLSLLAPGGHLAFLLPLSFAASKQRRALFVTYPCRYQQPIAGRPAFIGKTTGSQEYGLFVWRQGFKGRGQILPPLEWKP
jgi:SAM-dependent methyltransferase